MHSQMDDSSRQRLILQKDIHTKNRSSYCIVTMCTQYHSSWHHLEIYSWRQSIPAESIRKNISTHNTLSMNTQAQKKHILDPWEQALEDAPSETLWLDPYGIGDLARSARTSGETYITIPVSRITLSRLHEKAKKAHKTTSTYLAEVVEVA